MIYFDNVYIFINWKVEPSEPAQMTKEFMEDMVKLTSYKDPVYDEVMKAVGHIQPQKMVTQFISHLCKLWHFALFASLKFVALMGGYPFTMTTESYINLWRNLNLIYFFNWLIMIMVISYGKSTFICMVEMFNVCQFP